MLFCMGLQLGHDNYEASVNGGRGPGPDSWSGNPFDFSDVSF